MGLLDNKVAIITGGGKASDTVSPRLLPNKVPACA